MTTVNLQRQYYPVQNLRITFSQEDTGGGLGLVRLSFTLSFICVL
jgi:hypothetical protein